MQISLSCKERLLLESLIRSQKEKPDSEELQLLLDIKSKIGFEDSYRAALLREVPGIGVIINESVINSMEREVFDFERAEVRKFLNLLLNYSITIDDAVTVLPLIDTLKGALK